ncbi:MAG: putative acyl-CoA dehydrogenase [Frankiales bacterium]|nr:putative acyl-CoA dehydrogenase [Frankiales bacterium]
MEFELATLSPSERALQDEVRTFLAKTLPSDFRPGLGIAAPHDPSFSTLLAEQGWVGMAIPVEYGGQGRTAVERFVVTEELMAAGAPIGAHYVADRQTAPALLKYGTEQQRRQFLPPIAAGECWFSLGMSEPDAGSDLASVRTTARPADGGWSVTGTKIWTSNAHLNQYFVVLCRTAPLGEDRHAGLSQLIVDLRAPGVKINPIPFLDGSHHFNEVVLDGVFVAHDMVLGEPGSGWGQVTSELSYERSGPDRYLSTMPVVREFVRAFGGDGASARRSAGAEVYEAVGAITARLWAIRQLSLSVARSLDAGAAPAVESALVKDLGTCFEQLSIELMRLAMPSPLGEIGELDPAGDSMLERLLAETVLTGPSFTLRGGTTEILRSVAAKGLGR